MSRTAGGWDSIASRRRDLRALAEGGLTGSPHPTFPGVVIGLDDGSERELIAAGDALRYDAAGALLPPERRQPVHSSTVFDLASLTKLAVAICVVGELPELDAPVGSLWPGWDRAATSGVTVRHLLTHTSGLPDVLHLWQDEPDPARRRAAVRAADPLRPPGTAVVYSCTGYLVLQQLVEHRTGRRLDELVAERITGPLGLADTGFRPRRHGIGADRIAATEVRDATYRTQLGDALTPITPDPVDLRGVVHDENAASLGGVAGNAGLFGTAEDLLLLGRRLLDAILGRSDFPGLSAEQTAELVRPQLEPGVEQPGYASGLGFRIDDPGFMGALAGTGRAYGHTGFTGTSLVLDGPRDLVVVMLTNRVHPSRDWSDLQPFRRAVHDALAGR